MTVEQALEAATGTLFDRWRRHVSKEALRHSHAHRLRFEARRIDYKPSRGWPCSHSAFMLRGSTVPLFYEEAPDADHG